MECSGDKEEEEAHYCDLGRNPPGAPFRAHPQVICYSEE